MKKNKTYYSENNQENEDVYTLHPGNAIIYKNEMNNEEDISHHKDTINPVPSSAEMQLRLLAYSHSMTLSRIIETHTAQSPLL